MVSIATGSVDEGAAYLNSIKQNTAVGVGLVR
jgi:hypothetical protein